MGCYIITQEDNMDNTARPREIPLGRAERWMVIYVRLDALKPFCEGNPDAEFQFDRVLRAVQKAEDATWKDEGRGGQAK